MILVFGGTAACTAEPDTSVVKNDATTTASSTKRANALDACVMTGGHLLPDGFCFKSCADDVDCAPLDAVCGAAGHCAPAAWAGACTSDAACGLGGKCVRSTCRIGCESDVECGSLRCVLSCANGHFGDVRFCAGDDGWPANASEPTLCTSP
jgi:hypothetical protein